MSELIRYNIKPSHEGYEIAVSLGGEWVHWTDYAELKAESIQDAAQLWQQSEELKRLRASSFVTAVPCEQYDRVVKAGDAMAKRTEFFQKRWDADELCQEVEAWQAAKEGKPSV